MTHSSKETLADHIEAYLDNAVKELLIPENRRRIRLTREWAKSLPNEAGVYAVFENKRLVYVGETGNIRERMKDLLDSRNHTLPRNVGRANFSNIKRYKNATTKKKFPRHI